MKNRPRNNSAKAERAQEKNLAILAVKMYNSGTLPPGVNPALKHEPCHRAGTLPSGANPALGR